jgi:hypothetical protein
MSDPTTNGAQENGIQTSYNQVIIEGFLLVYNVPSVNLLDRTYPLEYKDTVIGKKITNLVRGYFRNRVTTLRKEWYKLLEDTTIRLGEKGKMQQIRILTFDKVPEFTTRKDALIEKWKEFDYELERFLLFHELPEKEDNNPRRDYNLEYLTEIKEFLCEELEMDINDLTDFFSPPKFHQHLYLNYIEMSFETQIFEEYLEEKGRNAVDEVDREKLRLLKQVKREVALQKEAQINQALIDINKRVDAIMERLTMIELGELTKKSLKRVSKEMNEVVDLANSANLFGKVAKRIDALNNLQLAMESDNPQLLRNAVSDAQPLFKDVSRLSTLRLRMLTAEKKAQSDEKE